MSFGSQTVWPPDRSSVIVDSDGRKTGYFFNWLNAVYALLNKTLLKGYTGTIVTAKLTGGGTNGSMTFVNGVVVSQVAAT